MQLVWVQLLFLEQLFGQLFGQLVWVQLPSLKQLSEQLSEQSASDDNEDAPGTRPLVVIIDELDRCRPPFALSLLERTKHLFSVDGICFMLVAHMPQLDAIVRAAYGIDNEARLYLEKFFMNC